MAQAYRGAQFKKQRNKNIPTPSIGKKNAIYW
jgi:hypothetical protein